MEIKTLNEQIERLRELIRRCYGVVVSKGGEIPEAGERTMENLSAAIESVPQNGLFDSLLNIGWTPQNVLELNTKRDLDLEYSESVKNKTIHGGDTKLVYVPYTENKTTLVNFIKGCSNVRFIPKIDCSSIVKADDAFTNAFSGLTSQCEVYLYNINLESSSIYVAPTICYGSSGIVSFTALGNIGFQFWNYPFYGCTRLTSMTLGDCSKMPNFDFLRSSGVKTIKNFSVEKLPDVSMANAFNNLTDLTHESLINILNALPNSTNGYTCTLGSSNLAKLTDEEKAIAVDKGWTLN